MRMPIRQWTGLLTALFLVASTACSDDSRTVQTEAPADTRRQVRLDIVAGSESKHIEEIIQSCARKASIDVRMHYSGSVDMMLDMKRPEFPHDAVLPASSVWLRLGDQDLHRVKEEASIMRSPVVLGIKTSVARSLGWVGNTVVTVGDILAAVESGRFRFAMTSATQSNSGFSSYIGMLVALAGKPDVLLNGHFEEPGVQRDIRKLLSGVNRGSGSSGWLMETFVKDVDRLDAMFNYESMVIAANQELIRRGKEPLYLIYPVDGLAVADSTLGFINKPDRPDNAQKLESFVRLRDCLLSDVVQERILKTGFRAGLIGMNPDSAPPDVYNPEWGIDLKRTISPIVWPDAEVTYRALTLYQTVFRKPSFTVFAVDCSGSMKGQGLEDLKHALTELFDTERSGRYLIQTGRHDITVVLPFDDKFLWREPLRVEGSDPENLGRLIRAVQGLQTRGGTNIYNPVAAGWRVFQEAGEDLQNYLPSIILMTDGLSQQGSIEELKLYWMRLGAAFDMPPVFCIMYGQADDTQLKAIAETTTGRVFDGRRGGLEKAFRTAKGYN